MRAAIIGAAGYVAPRHARAVVEHGGELVCACDTSDSIGYLDAIAPDCIFEPDPERFFEERLGELGVTHVIVCTPNHLHAAHTERALSAGCDAVLEKPLAIKGRGANSAEDLLAIARAHPRNAVYPIVQLRYDAGIQKLREHVAGSRKHFHCEIDYCAYRGDWYRKSWKADNEKSGGLLVNIGVHLFDLCSYVFGSFLHPRETVIQIDDRGAEEEAVGLFRCERATVAWRLSIRQRESLRTFRVAGTEFDLSNRIQVLHGEAYDRIFRGERFELADVAQGLRAIDEIYARALIADAATGGALEELVARLAARKPPG